MSASSEIRLAAEEIQMLIGHLNPKQQLRALRNTLRQDARRVKAAAVRELRKTKIHNAGKIGRTIRATSYRDLSGLLVAANPHGNKSMHINRRGKMKPVAFWWNIGTEPRFTKGNRRSKEHATGMIQRHDYMAKGEQAEMPNVRARIAQTFVKNVQRIAQSTFKR